MSQYSSRINIRVSSPSVWRRFKDTDDAEFDLAELAYTKSTSFVYDDEWSCIESEIEGIVEALSKTLKNDGIIIADTADINVDPYNYCVFYFGSGVKTAYFCDDNGNRDMRCDTQISDIAGWINYAELSLSEKERNHLFRFGIASSISDSKVVYEEFSQTLAIEDRILLRKTGANDRANHIETVNLLDKVRLSCAKATADDPHLIEVFCKDKSIGFLPSSAGDELFSLIAAERLDYEARVIKVVPLSRRNKHAKSPIVEIHIETTDSYKTLNKVNHRNNDTIQLGIVGEASEYSLSLARSVSDAPKSVEFQGKIFVHTSCLKEKEIDDLVASRGGEVKSSTVLKTDYLIIGNDIDHETGKITRTKELIGQGKKIIALTESEFWKFASANDGDIKKETEKSDQSQAQTEECVADMSVWEKYLS